MEGEEKIATELGTATLIVDGAVVEPIIGRHAVLMAAEAEGERGIAADFVLEELRHVVVELVGKRLGMHGHDGARHTRRQGIAIGADKGEIGYGDGIVVLEGVRVEAQDMEVARIEGEVGRAEEVAVDIGSRSQAVVITEQHDIGHMEFFENIALKFKLTGHTEIGEITTVDDEVDIATRIDGTHAVVRFVIPALGVADHGEAHRVASGTLLFDAGGIAAVDVMRAMHAGVVRMIINQVTARQDDSRRGGYQQTKQMMGLSVHILTVVRERMGKGCFIVKKTLESKGVFSIAKLRTFHLLPVFKKSEELDKWFALCLHGAGRG